MSARTFAGRSGRSVMLITAGLLAGAGGAGAAVALASSGSTNSTIYACVETMPANSDVGAGEPVTTPGNVRIIDPSADQACRTTQDGNYFPEEQISWNQTGPQGPAGNVVTLANQTFTISGIQKVATIANTPPTSSASSSDGKPVATVTVDGGRGFPTVPIPILSFDLTVSAVTSVAGGRKAFKPLQIVKSVDRSSPEFFQAATSGTRLTKVILKVPKVGGHLGLTVTLRNVIVAGLQQTNVAGKGGGLREVITLEYSTLTYSYSS